MLSILWASLAMSLGVSTGPRIDHAGEAFYQQPTYAINTTSTVNAAIAAGGAGICIRVLSFDYSVDAAQQVTLENATSGTDRQVNKFTAAGGIVKTAPAGACVFQLGSNEALKITVTTGALVTGSIQWGYVACDTNSL